VNFWASSILERVRGTSCLDVFRWCQVNGKVIAITIPTLMLPVTTQMLVPFALVLRRTPLLSFSYGVSARGAGHLGGAFWSRFGLHS